MHCRVPALALACLLALAACTEETAEPTGPSAPSLARTGSSGMEGINVVLKAPATRSQLAQLNTMGTVKKQFIEINGLTMAAKADRLDAIRALPFVQAAAIDQDILIPPPTDLVEATDFTGGFSSWNQDAINVTRSPGPTGREMTETGDGVFVGVLDTGLNYTWRQYFPEERIAVRYARSIVGGGALDRGSVDIQTNDQWQRDVCSHGTHVTSTILGYQLGTAAIQGTAPKATVIPVRLHSQGSATAHVSCFFRSSVAAAGLLYFAELKRGPLANSPLVVNNSWGNSIFDPLVKAAVDEALEAGVLLVFSAGNRGDAGMSYPGAYAPVISAAATGWIGEWVNGTSWWNALDVAEPTNPAHFYITDFSSRALAGQDLDVAAPGSWVVGPFQNQRGKPSYFFLGGTSMAAPHITGTVALMLEKNPGLTQANAESILEGEAIPFAAGCRNVLPAPGAQPEEICWEGDATGSGLLDAEAAVLATP